MHKAVDKWLSTATQNSISFSLETHVSGKYFLFDGLIELEIKASSAGIEKSLEILKMYQCMV